MKFRVSFLLAIAFTGVVFMSSCVKKYTCECVVKYSGAPNLPDSVVTDYSITDNKKDASSKCEAESATHDVNGIHSVETCKLF